VALNTMRCVERIGKSAFTLSDVYRFESELAACYPANRHIRQNIRRQLQVLRDKGYLTFQGQGKYLIC
jgi:type II restriction enzyme